MNAHGTPREIQSILKKIDAVVHALAAVEKRDEAKGFGMNKNFSYAIELSLKQLQNKEDLGFKVKQETGATKPKEIKIMSDVLEFWIALALRSRKFLDEVRKEIKREAVFIPNDQACGRLITELQREGT